MNPLTTLLHDLRSKRLLPVAVLLAAAAVAIPFVIGGGGGDTAAVDAAVAPLPAPAAEARPAVELVGPPAVRSRPGKVRDPFRRVAKAKPSSSNATPASSGSQDGSKSSTAASKGSAKSGAAKSTTKSKAPAVAPTVSKAARTVYETTARFKGANHDYVHPLEVLDVFGDPANPALQYAGVADGGEYAIFVLGPGATASNEAGACVVADPCRAIGLRKGDTLRVSVAFPGAATRNYVLEVLGLRRVTKRTEKAAKAYRRDFDTLGEDVRKAISRDAVTAATLKQLRYSRRSGTVSLVAP